MAPYIAMLDLARNRPGMYSRCKVEAAMSEMDIRQFIGDPKPSALYDYINDSAGLWLRRSTFLHDKSIIELILDAIKRGKRCLVEPRLTDLAMFNDFLSSFGLQGTHMGLVPINTVQGVSQSLLRIERQIYPGAFRHPVLLNNVETVLLQRPQLLYVRETASPVLTAPLSGAKIVDTETDLFERIPATAVSVMAVGGDTSNVLAMTGCLLDDPLIDSDGLEYPGINENKILAGNILTWLANDKPNPIFENACEAYKHIYFIESTIAKYLRSVLERVHSDWWSSGVPKPIRDRCSERAKDEGNQLPEHCYLDLIHWKKIAKLNWGFIRSDWNRAGWGSSKKSGLGWFDKLNEVRKIVAHITKQEFGVELSPDQMDFVRNLKTQVALLHES